LLQQIRHYGWPKDHHRDRSMHLLPICFPELVCSITHHAVGQR
jgi:hypothetical protein